MSVRDHLAVSSTLIAPSDLDSSGKGRPGMLADNGPRNDLGAPSVCLDIQVEDVSKPSEGDQPFASKFCQLTISVNSNEQGALTCGCGELQLTHLLAADKLSAIEREIRSRTPITFGLCMPLACETQFIEKSIKKCNHIPDRAKSNNGYYS